MLAGGESYHLTLLGTVPSAVAQRLHGSASQARQPRLSLLSPIGPGTNQTLLEASH